MTPATTTAMLERDRARRYPISRWYVRPMAAWLASWLCRGPVRPAHLTLCGLLVAATAAGLLIAWPGASFWVGLLVLGAWFFDRADGLLARRQQTESAWGAWLDANVDELVDLGLHVAVASAAAARTGSSLPWTLLIAFLFGKYLLMHGLATEPSAPLPEAERNAAEPPQTTFHRVLRGVYHLPANADVRTHLLIVCLLFGWLTAELAVVAAYYNARWIARYILVARRAGGWT